MNNPAFDSSPEEAPEAPKKVPLNGTSSEKLDSEKDGEKQEEEEPERVMWGNQIEFLMSCISTSVGLGNIWRFPFVAYENGGGAFLIPYIIVLILIGKPMYYLEGVIGQFSSRNSVKVWSLAPAMRGTGYAQAAVCGFILSYYVSIVALCMYYLAMSFQSELPWAICQPEWQNCVPSSATADNFDIPPNATSSAELYFVNTVLQQVDDIEDGLGGLPIWYLSICLFISWLIIFGIISRSVKSTGKAAYFLAIFPYIVMITLLITTCLLEGAWDGMLFFLTPQWEELLSIRVWYAAVTQVFFSLSVCTGAIIMFSSYNGFRQNVYRDAMIVTTLDTFTSLLSGITIFGILGSLAYNLKRPVSEVVTAGGTSLAFISYPDAVSKTFQPQLFSVLFFTMMTVLGVGSSVALMQTLNTVMMDAFPKVKVIIMGAICCTVGFLIGLIYVTPGGQYILELVDHYGATFLCLFTSIVEMFGVIWIYGLENICLDIEFMLNMKTSIYWRFCWGILTPGILILVFFFALISSDEPKFGGTYVYPFAGYASGYAMLIGGMLLVPIIMLFVIRKNRTGNFVQTIKKSFHAKESWGPRSLATKREWVLFKQDAKDERNKIRRNRFHHFWLSLTGGYRRHVVLPKKE